MEDGSVPTKVVYLRDGQKAVINEADFNPDQHSLTPPSGEDDGEPEKKPSKRK